MFFYRSTIEIDGFSMVFPNSGTMVCDGFDLEKDLKMRISMTDPILRELYVLFRIQITLLLVSFRCKSTLKYSVFFLRFKVGCCVCRTFSTLFCYHRKLSMVFKVSITIEWNGSGQGPTSTRYSNQTRIFLYYSNPTRKFLKNDRVASSMYSSHFRKIAALP